MFYHKAKYSLLTKSYYCVMKNTTVKCIELPYATTQGEFKLKVNTLAPLKIVSKSCFSLQKHFPCE